MEALGKVTAVALDKTGTLTEGVFTISEYKIFDPSIDARCFFSILLTIEQFSSHPMAVAICNYAKEQRALVLGEVNSFETIKGEGVCAKYDGKWM